MGDVNATVDVDQPLTTVYNQWTQFEEFPRFMQGVEEVVQEDDTTLRWRAQIAGVERTWRAKITEQDPDRGIAWQSTEGTRNNGRVTFKSLGPNTTRVFLVLDLEPKDFVEKAGEALGFIDRRAQGDLDRFREFIESRSNETGAWRGEISGGEVDGGGRSPMETPAEVDPEGSDLPDSKDENLRY
jgi:uncharacterized membrane protein